MKKKQGGMWIVVGSMIGVTVLGVIIGSLWSANQPKTDESIEVLICGDLALTSVLAKPSAGLGTSMIVTDTTANVHATCTSAITTTAFWLSAASNGVAICNLGTHTTPQLPPGSNWVMSKLVTICGTTTGSLWLVDVADRDKKTGDNNYSNNTNSRPITITP